MSENAQTSESMLDFKGVPVGLVLRVPLPVFIVKNTGQYFDVS